MTTTLTPPLTTTLTGLPTIPAGYGRMLNPVSEEARVLERTADLLISDGWCQGTDFRADGALCMTAAVARAIAQLFPFWSEPTRADLHMEVCGLLHDAIGDLEGGDVWPENWNDRPGRTVNQVLDVIAMARTRAS